MTAPIRFPTDDTIFQRLTQRQREANIAAERAEVIRDAKRCIDRPGRLTDAELREVCIAFMAMRPTPDELADDWNVYYQRADQHLYAINRREWQERNCPRPETSAQVFMRQLRYRRQIAMGTACWVTIMLMISGWT